MLEESITFKSLTRLAKDVIIEIWKSTLHYDDYCDENGEWCLSNEDVEDFINNEWWDDAVSDHDLMYEIGLFVNTGNYFSGEKGYRGVSVDLNNIEQAKQEFRKIVDLEPQVFNDVLVY